VWRAHRLANPEMRAAEAAVDLGVSEAELVATGCGKTATRLTADWSDLVADLHRLGPVQVESRNDHAVHNVTGTYADVAARGDSLVLQYAFRNWSTGFAVVEDSLPGLQFFDPHGTAVHKVGLTADSRVEAYAALVSRYRHDDQETLQGVEPRRPDPWKLLDAQVDVAALTARWHDLQTENEFDEMLYAAKVGHVQALRLVPNGLATAVVTDAPRRVLETVAANATPVRITVANAGVAQTHVGTISSLQLSGRWLRVSGPRLHLQLEESAVASVWIVRKPTRDGIISVLEVFDACERPICEVRGTETARDVEDPAWRFVLAAAIRGEGDS
jgi:putative hemin transport protein